MSARGPVLPRAERRCTDPIRRSAQARRGAGIEVGVADPVTCRAGPVTEIVEVGVPHGLPRAAEPVEGVEGRVADVGAGAGLGERHAGNEQE